MNRQLRVTFQPHGRAVYVLAGTRLLEAAGLAGMTVETPCGGAGSCGKCRVRITSGASPPGSADMEFFSQSELDDGWRLACQASIRGDTVVTVPDSSLFADRHQILAEAQSDRAEDVLPTIRKQFVRIDADSGLPGLQTAVGAVEADAEIAGLLDACGGEGTAVLSDHRLVDFEPGDTTAQCYGAAFDIGTTTLVGSLLDLNTGDEAAIASAINPQTSLGDDVLTRIRHVRSSAEGAAELRGSITQAVDELISELCRRAEIDRDRIYELAFTGNTTMEHLLCGLDVAPLGEIPFAPITTDELIVPADQLCAGVHRRAAAYVFPVIGGFVGGDTVACILAAGLERTDATVLMIDIGTNGEIVLARGGQLWAASTAAGPAFEGARISCGMRATEGAIEKVMIDGGVEVNVIGSVEPTGMCGSGLIDLAAGLLDSGAVSPQGRLLGGEDLPDSLSQSLRDRISPGVDGQGEFLIAEGSGGLRITLTQRDIRELQLGAGAIRAGISILLKQAGLEAADLDQVLIAGGFGSFIRRSKAQRIGLMPADVPHSRIKYIGNAALNGARWALLSTRVRTQARRIARSVQHVQLSKDPDFQTEFAESMIFPAGGNDLATDKHG